MIKKLSVILVHGTWARNALWIRFPSRLCTTLANELGSEIELDYFKWSGANSHEARRKAASDLATRIRLKHKADTVDGCVLIGHSHGGNVVRAAAAEVGVGVVNGVACLATPFLMAEPRGLVAFRLFLTGIVVLAIGLALPAATILLIFGLGKILPRFADALVILTALSLVLPTSGFVGWIGIGIATIYARAWFSLLEMPWDDYRFYRLHSAQKRRADQYCGREPSTQIRQLVLRYGIDEAYWGLLGSALPSWIVAVVTFLALGLVIVIAGASILWVHLQNTWAVFTLNVDPYPLFMPTAMLLLFCVVVGGAVVLVGVLLAIMALGFGLMHGFASGTFSLLDILMIRICVRRYPRNSSAGQESVSLDAGWAKSPLLRVLQNVPLVAGLAHSRIYADPVALAKLVSWIKDIRSSQKQDS